MSEDNDLDEFWALEEEELDPRWEMSHHYTGMSKCPNPNCGNFVKPVALRNDEYGQIILGYECGYCGRTWEDIGLLSDEVDRYPDNCWLCRRKVNHDLAWYETDYRTGAMRSYHFRCWDVVNRLRGVKFWFVSRWRRLSDGLRIRSW